MTDAVLRVSVGIVGGEERDMGSCDEAEAEALIRWWVGEVGESVRPWDSGQGEVAPMVGVERGS